MSKFKYQSFILCDEVKVPFIHKERDHSKSISMLHGTTYYEGTMEGIQTTHLFHSFWKVLCMKDETLVYCLMTIIISVPLETSFCSVSILLKLKDRIIFTCLVLKWYSETRYEMDKIDNWWRQPLKSRSPTFISPACLWATAYVNNLLLCLVQ